MKPPIMVWGEATLDLFESPEAAEGYIESPEVEEGLLEAFDSEGRRLRFEVLYPPGYRKPRWTVDVLPLRLVAAEEAPGGVADLRGILIHWLGTVSEREGLEELDLDALVAEAAGVFTLVAQASARARVRRSEAGRAPAARRPAGGAE